MPPPESPRPAERDYEAVIATLVSALDEEAKRNPNPGRTDTLRRLTRLEYQNSIRDLLDLEVDVRGWLPAEEASHGFDNVTVGDLSATRLDRYITAATKIARIAVGSGGRRSPVSETVRMPADVTQEEHVEGLPQGTRGGLKIPFNFPQTGEYEVQVRLMRDRNEEIEGLKGTHELEILLDRERKALLEIKGGGSPREREKADAHLQVRFKVDAGPHALGVTFLKNPSSLLETKRQPLNVHFNTHRHPRQAPAVYQVTISGPFTPEGAGDTPSRRRIFVRRPESESEEPAVARQILSALARRAYRRPVTPSDIEQLIPFYEEGRRQGDFESGIESALTAILVSPQFLLRVEADPSGLGRHAAYLLSDFELASRLSFFLWSSIPDERLLDAAERGELKTTEGISKQVRRMLADPRASTLATNFADQWLYLRNLDSMTPDARLFPDFDDNLRQAFRKESELVFEAVLREDRSVRELLKSDWTYLNERLARHYGIPHVVGSRFRRVPLEPAMHRGGILRQGSVLMVTSYATRTSPVIRGNWVLKNVLGAPAPPPPANVPALKDQTVDASLSLRDRLAEHRDNAACASCHRLMDPVGFALENFDAVGRWRSAEEGQPIDVSGTLPGTADFQGIDGLEVALLQHPELFAGTLTERLMTYALGRGVEPGDAPAIREIVRSAAKDDLRLSSLIVGITTSTPFRMRRTP